MIQDGPQNLRRWTYWPGESIPVDPTLSFEFTVLETITVDYWGPGQDFTLHLRRTPILKTGGTARHCSSRAAGLEGRVVVAWTLKSWGTLGGCNPAEEKDVRSSKRPGGVLLMSPPGPQGYLVGVREGKRVKQICTQAVTAPNCVDTQTFDLPGLQLAHLWKCWVFQSSFQS